VGTEPVDFCREIETYLCKKNDGHLIRVTGPSFEIVSRWAEQGIPIKIACAGIDRYFERYYRKGPRRRPVKIDFCEADVLDAFDEWRKAVGVSESRANLSGSPDKRGPSLDTARGSSSGVRGEARQALLSRLAALDLELLHGARASLSEIELAALTREADDELASFRDRMTADAFAKAVDGVLSRLIRERFGLPTMTFL
jgi:hypothetical protein